jgi:3-hydroxyisobutyrate dehydrogenase-like beta-hydroxyacid dehydrogenase
MTFDRSLVLGADESMAVIVLERSGRVVVTVDGQIRGVLDPGDWLSVYAAPERAQLVRLTEPDFFGRVRDRFRVAGAVAAEADGGAPPFYRPNSPVPPDLRHLYLPQVSRDEHDDQSPPDRQGEDSQRTVDPQTGDHLMNQQTPTIGFIGLGLMGGRMAGRLLGAGYTLTVYNRTQERTLSLAERGATVARTPQELARTVDVVMLSLADDSALDEVMHSAQGILASLRPGATVIDLSTVSPRIARALALEVKVRGGAMLDTPVSGSTAQAEEGTLNILVGGDEDTYRRSEPNPDVLGKQRFYLGPNGMGLVMKLTINTILGLGVQALAEAIALGEGAGLAKDRLLDVLGQMAVVSPAQRSKLENARSESYPPTFPLQHMDKDYGLIAELAMQAHVPLPATAAAHQITKAARTEAGEEDFSAVIRLMEQLAGLDGGVPAGGQRDEQV